MTLDDYVAYLTELDFGKRLPKALYVYWQSETDLGLHLVLVQRKKPVSEIC